MGAIVAFVQSIGLNADQLTSELADFLRLAIRPGQDEALRLASELELSMSQLRALFLLDTNDAEFAVHELAEMIGLSMGATGRALDHLVRAGLVSRREDQVDRRVKRISITAEGERAIAGIATAKRAGLRRFAEGLDAAERDQLSRALAPILARHAAGVAEPALGA
jgi:DNA-binding MarR family transcriptional regulator